MTDSAGVETASQAKNAREFIAETWRRARINAFAHRIAYEDASRMARWLDFVRVFLTLASLLSIIAVYLFSSADAGVLAMFTEHTRKAVAFWATFASIIFTFGSLMFDYINAQGEYKVAAEEHKYILGSFQYIAQRAREARWPDRPYPQLVELLHHLERDFQLLKARGTEPSDRIFEEANALFRKIGNEPIAREAQSFPVESTSPEPPDGPSAEAAETSQRNGVFQRIWNRIRRRET